MDDDAIKRLLSLCAYDARDIGRDRIRAFIASRTESEPEWVHIGAAVLSLGCVAERELPDLREVSIGAGGGGGP